MATEGFKMLQQFIHERHRIALKKKEGRPRPWTKDPILHSYSFTNVYREWDRTTVWIRDNWREPFRDHPNIITAMAMARFINNPDTLDYIGFPALWSAEPYKKMLKSYTGRTFSPAYIISTNGIAMDKGEYVMDLIDRVHHYPFEKKYMTLRSFAEDLLDIKGIGTFMAGQIVADLKFTPMLISVSDWYDWCAIGPGSSRGLNYVCGEPVNSSWTDKEFVRIVNNLRGKLKLLPGMAPLSAQDVQNCLCEFSKYRKCQLGLGKPKRLYRPQASERNLI